MLVQRAESRTVGGHSRELAKKWQKSWAPVAHTCNPSFSGGRDQEVLSSKPAWANNSGDPISNTTQNRAGVMDQVGKCCLASVRSWVQIPIPPKKKKWQNVLTMFIVALCVSVFFFQYMFVFYCKTAISQFKNRIKK
jgi:hypothetical protein